MVIKLLYLLFVWIYYVGEGLTEAMFWSSRRDSKLYHTIRELVENMGRRILFAYLGYLIFGSWLGVLFWFLAEGSGLIIYEFVFRKQKYGSFFHKKDGYWESLIFLFKYPSWQLMLVFLIAFITSIVCILE